MIDVGCAIILRNPYLLIAQRKPGDSLAGYWEFPGGKLEDGEELGQCLRREVFEELRVEIEPRRILRQKIYQYPSKQLRLHFVLCDWIRGKPVKHDCYDFKWAPPEGLRNYPFLPADADILYELNLKKVVLFRKDLF